MSKFVTFVFAVAASTATLAPTVSLAGSAETAIRDWIAAVDPAAWTVEYQDLTYDAATDTTVLSGLTVSTASFEGSLTFDTISVTGFVQQPDGAFSAAALTADAGSLTTLETTVAISGAAFSDFGADTLTGFVWDPDHPFTSIVKAYANVTKIHVASGKIDTVAIDAQSASGDSQIDYTDLAISGWADGKIASITSGRLTIASEDANGPVKVSIAGFESRNTDFDAILRVYDPDRYENGVGDRIWRSALGFAEYRDFTVEAPEATVTIASVAMEDVKVRQPEHSFAAILDQAVLSPDTDPGPDGIRSILDMASAFALGRLTVSGVDVNAGGSDGGHLDAFTLADYSLDGIGEISIDGLNVSVDGEGHAQVGRLAVGGLQFPPIDALVAAAVAADAGDDVDPNTLSVKLGFAEAASVDVDMGDKSKVVLEKARLDLADYVGVVPTSIALDVTGLDAPVGIAGDDDTALMLRMLGYDRVNSSYALKVKWNETDETLSINAFDLSAKGVGSLQASAVLTGVSRFALEHVETLSDSIVDVGIQSATVNVTDDSLFGRWIAEQAYLTQMDQGAFRQQLADSIPDMIADLGDDAFRDTVAKALTTFVMMPGSLTATANPPDAMPVIVIAGLAGVSPSLVPEALGLMISATAGPEPLPFDYVPPPDLVPPEVTPGPDLTPVPAAPGGRHVPERKKL